MNLESLTDTEYQALPDSVALADVRMPDSPPPPKEYTAKGRAEWAREMDALYPDGFDMLKEDPMLGMTARMFDPHGQDAEPIFAMLGAGLGFDEIPDALGATAEQIMGIIVKRGTVTWDGLRECERAVRDGEHVKRADLAERCGLPPNVANRVIDAIGATSPLMKKGYSRLTYTMEQREQALDLWAQGRGKKEIAEITGIKFANVVTLIKNHGEPRT